MLPATRTPEGEPHRCTFCGGEYFLLVSDPPGDSVCPACGMHAWVAETTVPAGKRPVPLPMSIPMANFPPLRDWKCPDFDEPLVYPGESRTRTVREFLLRLKTLGQDKSQRVELQHCFVSGLMKYMRAWGVAYRTVRPANWLLLRRRGWKLEAAVGYWEVSQIAEAVYRRNQSTIRVSMLFRKLYLAAAVPVRKQGVLVGVVDAILPADVTAASQAEYLGFMEQMVTHFQDCLEKSNAVALNV